MCIIARTYVWASVSLCILVFLLVCVCKKTQTLIKKSINQPLFIHPVCVTADINGRHQEHVGVKSFNEARHKSAEHSQNTFVNKNCR